MNRFLLLGGMLACFLLPLVEYKTATHTLLQTPMIELEETIAEANFFSQSVSVPNHVYVQPTPRLQPGVSSGNLLFYVYCTGVAVSFLFFVISLIRIGWIVQHSTRKPLGKYILCLTEAHICPFSFGKYIVLSMADYQEHQVEILLHEQVHAQKGHTFDLLFVEILALLQWFNPAVWLLKRELRDIHEYEADLGVLNKDIDATKYQLLLVKKAVGSRRYTIANSFNHSKIKNRITMMLKEKSNRWARLKLLLFVPLAAGMLQAFARPQISRQLELLTVSESTTILQESKKWTEEFFRNEKNRCTGLSQFATPYEVKYLDNGMYLVGDGGIYLFINNLGDVLLQNELVGSGNDELVKRLGTLIDKINLKRKNTTKPLGLYVRKDKDTPENKYQDILDKIGLVYQGKQENTTTTKGSIAEKYPFIVFFEYPVGMPKKKDGIPPPPPPPAFILDLYKNGGNFLNTFYSIESLKEARVDLSKVDIVVIRTHKSCPKEKIAAIKQGLVDMGIQKIECVVYTD